MEIGCSVASCSSSSSSLNLGDTVAAPSNPPAAILAPRLPTRLGTGVGSTRRISTLATGVSGTEMVGIGAFLLASSTQSLKFESSSSSSFNAPPKDRFSNDLDREREYEDRSVAGVYSVEMLDPSEEVDDRRGRLC